MIDNSCTYIPQNDRLPNPTITVNRTLTYRLLRIVLIAVIFFVLVLGVTHFTSASAAELPIKSVRIWPGPDYTRITLESPHPLKHSLFMLDNPDRLVLDLEDAALSTNLTELPRKVSATDPQLKGIRVGRFKPTTIRLVFDLKKRMKPEAFALAPVAEYGHRLVIDIYPAEPIDPLGVFLKQQEVNTQKNASITSPGTPAINDAIAPKPAPTTNLTPTPTPIPNIITNPIADKMIIIAIDAGHGGEDPGAKGRNGNQEKDVTLAIATKLKERIDNEPNMQAVLIRDGDYFIPLHVRVDKARRFKADLFLSIHADAFVQPSANGSSVFALSERGATSAAARWLAQKENSADLIGGVNFGVKDQYLKQTLLDLSQTASINDSLKLGKAVLTEMGTLNRLHKGHVEQAGFAVLKAPDIPSILIETAFISNPDEELKLSNPEYQYKMADVILNGVKQYFSKNPLIKPNTITRKP